MRHRIINLSQRACARIPGLLTLLVVLAAAGSASAGRPRGSLPPSGDTLPAVPEPGAAIAFGLGVGVVAWAVRRHRR